MNTMGADMNSVELEQAKHDLEHMIQIHVGEANATKIKLQPWEPLADQTIKADAGKAQLRLVPMQILEDIARIREYGNAKYGDSESWQRVDPDRYLDAMLRHAIAFVQSPKSVDEESGLPHLWHLACNVAFLSEFYKKGAFDAKNK